MAVATPFFSIPSPHHNAFWNPSSGTWQLQTTFLGSDGLPFSNPTLSCGHCGGFHKSKFCAGIVTCRVCGDPEDEAKVTTVFVKDVGNHFPRHSICHDKSSVCRVCRRASFDGDPFVIDHTSMFPRHSSCPEPLFLSSDPKGCMFKPPSPATLSLFPTRILNPRPETLIANHVPLDNCGSIGISRENGRRGILKSRPQFPSPPPSPPPSQRPDIGNMTEFPPLG